MITLTFRDGRSPLPTFHVQTVVPPPMTQLRLHIVATPFGPSHDARLTSELLCPPSRRITVCIVVPHNELPMQYHARHAVHSELFVVIQQGHSTEIYCVMQQSSLPRRTASMFAA